MRVFASPCHPYISLPLGGRRIQNFCGGAARIVAEGLNFIFSINQFQEVGLKGHGRRFSFPFSHFTIHILLLTLLQFQSPRLHAQPAHPYADAAASITSKGLTELRAFAMLSELTRTIGSRLSGSPQAAKAVESGNSTMLKCGFDSAHLQPVMVPHWVRGSVERAWILDGEKESPLRSVLLAEVSRRRRKESLRKLLKSIRSTRQKISARKRKGRLFFITVRWTRRRCRRWKRMAAP